jgi:hypothetical protein
MSAATPMATPSTETHVMNDTKNRWDRERT